MRKVVYIAAPYSKPDPVANVKRAMECWHWLWESGVIAPVCPHLSMFLHLHKPLEYSRWMEYDLCLLERCDALVRLPGESAGADQEVERMKELGRPVFTAFGVEGVIAWARSEFLRTTAPVRVEPSMGAWVIDGPGWKVREATS